MDKQTLSEIGHTIIAIFITMMLVGFLTGSIFLSRSREIVDKTVPEHERQQYQTDDAFKAYLDGANQE